MTKTMKNEVNDLAGPILVTGAGGFIGFNVASILSSFRKDVYGAVHSLSSWRLQKGCNFEVCEADLTDTSQTANLLAAISPKTIIHCAAYGAYSSQTDSERIYGVNLQASRNLVLEAAKHELAVFINMGSSSEYGTNCSAPLESDFCAPNSDYAISKLAFTNFLSYYSSSHQFPGITLRLYSVYGPHEEPSRLIPTLIRSVHAGKWPPLVHPDISRDFIYIDDVVNACVQAALHYSRTKAGEIYNIGSSQITTIRSLTTEAAALFNITTQPQFNSFSNRSWDLPNWFSNSKKAQIELNWKPSYTLAMGLQKTSLAVKQDKLEIHHYSVPSKISKITAVVACYLDELAIPLMYERLVKTFDSLSVQYQIIFVNDCSPDSSDEVIRKISETDCNVIGINHTRNFGSQLAFFSGLKYCTGDCAVLLDGDLQDPPEIIPAFYQRWLEGYEVVYGIRTTREMKRRNHIFYKLFYRIFKLMSYLAIPNDAGDFSLLDKSVVNSLLLCTESDPFLRGLRAYVGYKQIGVSYHRPERAFGTSTNNLIKNLGWAKKGIISFSNTPLTALTFAGFTSLLLSISFAVVSILVRTISPVLVPAGLTTVICLILLFGSTTLLAVALVGEYILKIFTEVKNRPRFIVRHVTRAGKSFPP